MKFIELQTQYAFFLRQELVYEPLDWGKFLTPRHIILGSVSTVQIYSPTTLQQLNPLPAGLRSPDL